MLANMACSLIEHKRINTTVAKAKALRQFVEPLITKSKPENNVTAEKGTHNRRIVFKNLRDKYAVTELFGTVAEKVADRPGGYTRIIKLGNRLGDNADMAMIELVDFNELYNAGKPKKKSTRRSRRGGSKKSENKAVDVAEEANVTDGSEEAKAETGTQEQAKANAGKDVEAKQTETKKEPESKKPETEDSKTEKASEQETKSEEKAEAKVEEKPKAEEKPNAEAKSDNGSEDAGSEEDDTKKDDTKE